MILYFVPSETIDYISIPECFLRSLWVIEIGETGEKRWSNESVMQKVYDGWIKQI